MGLPISFCGIDPGNKGAICFLIPEAKHVEFVLNNLSGIVISEHIREFSKTTNLQMCMIEKVHAIQGTSAKSNFSFGYNAGFIYGLFSANGLPVDFVTPMTWQRSVGITKKPKQKITKQDVAEVAQRLYPKINLYGPRGGLHDGKSDALMIAHHAYLKYCKTEK